jgi:hypothetical protein
LSEVDVSCTHLAPTAMDRQKDFRQLAHELRLLVGVSIRLP